MFSDLEMQYCGESLNLNSRINTHKMNSEFANCYISIHVMMKCKPHHLKEREVDLIGAYMAEKGIGPRLQYKKR